MTVYDNTHLHRGVPVAPDRCVFASLLRISDSWLAPGVALCVYNHPLAGDIKTGLVTSNASAICARLIAVTATPLLLVLLNSEFCYVIKSLI